MTDRLEWDNGKRRALSLAVVARIEELMRLRPWIFRATAADLEVELGHGGLREFANFEEPAAALEQRSGEERRVTDEGRNCDVRSGEDRRQEERPPAPVFTTERFPNVARVAGMVGELPTMPPGQVLRLEDLGSFEGGVAHVTDRVRAVELFGDELGGAIGDWIERQPAAAACFPLFEPCSKCTRCKDDHPHEECELFEPGAQ